MLEYLGDKCLEVCNLPAHGSMATQVYREGERGGGGGEVSTAKR